MPSGDGWTLVDERGVRAAVIPGRAAHLLVGPLRRVIEETRRRDGLPPAPHVVAAMRELQLAADDFRLQRDAEVPHLAKGTGGTRAGVGERMMPGMSTEMAAQVIGVTPRYVRSLCAAGALPAELGPRGYVIDRADVAEYINSRRGS